MGGGVLALAGGGAGLGLMFAGIFGGIGLLAAPRIGVEQRGERPAPDDQSPEPAVAAGRVMRIVASA
jgi:hypothetical protein